MLLVIVYDANWTFVHRHFDNYLWNDAAGIANAYNDFWRLWWLQKLPEYSGFIGKFLVANRQLNCTHMGEGEFIRMCGLQASSMLNDDRLG